MTKAIRVENADGADYKVVVEVWNKDSNGGEDVLINTFKLDFPTAMLTEYIHDAQYLVIKEAK